jgi:diacylglycerol O-acyltransferase
VTIERLSPTDRLMLLADDIWPQEIGALAVLDGNGLWSADGELQIEDLRRRIVSRLPLVPRLRQVILRPAPLYGGPLWADARRFDIAEHVRVAEVAAPGGDDQLLACVERLRRRRLDPARPGWEMWFLTGLPRHEVGLFVKIHHAMADGMAAMTILGAFLDRADAVAGLGAPAPWRPAPAPRRSDLVAAEIRGHLRRVAGALGTLLHPRATWLRLRGAMPAVRELLADAPPPPTSLDGVLGQDRRLAVMRCTTRELRSIGRAHDATANDVLLALIAGGLRALLMHRGEPIEGVWAPIYVPITMRRRWRGPVAGNRVAQMAIPLPLSVADPAERLGRIAAATAAGKLRDRSAVGKLFRSSITTWLVLKAVDRQRVNVCSANIPGPRTPRFLLGSRVLEVAPILPLIGTVSLGVGAISYAGAVMIGITADRDAFPDLDVFMRGMRQELDALRTRPLPLGPHEPGSAADDTPLNGPAQVFVVGSEHDDLVAHGRNGGEGRLQRSSFCPADPVRGRPDVTSAERNDPARHFQEVADGPDQRRWERLRGRGPREAIG